MGSKLLLETNFLFISRLFIISHKFFLNRSFCESIKIITGNIDEIIRKGSVSSEERVTRAEAYRKLAEDALKKIESGELILSDASASSGNVFINKLYDDSVEPEIDKDKTQW